MIDKTDSRAGFTLIEIVTVLLILGLLSAFAVTKYFDLRDQASERVCSANRHEILHAVKTADALQKASFVGVVSDEAVVESFQGRGRLCPSGGLVTVAHVANVTDQSIQTIVGCSVHGGGEAITDYASVYEALASIFHKSQANSGNFKFDALNVESKDSPRWSMNGNGYPEYVEDYVKYLGTADGPYTGSFIRVTEGSNADWMSYRTTGGRSLNDLFSSIRDYYGSSSNITISNIDFYRDGVGSNRTFSIVGLTYTVNGKQFQVGTAGSAIGDVTLDQMVSIPSTGSSKIAWK